MAEHPGRTVTIYDIPTIVKIAYRSAFSKENICAGFNKSGITSFYEKNFTALDFAPSFVTDRVDENMPAKVPHISPEDAPSFVTDQVENMPAAKPPHVSPEDLQPFRKAPLRKQSNRKRVKSTILTDTPEKDAIEARKTNAKKKS